MPSDEHPTDDAARPPDPDVGVRLEAATTLIPADGEPEASGADAGGAVAAATPLPAPSPPLRIILALRPCPGEGSAGPTYDVTISADRGKDADCDPYWRSFAGLDLHGALDEVAGVVAGAEEQWRANPCYPRVAPQPANGGKGKTTAPAKRTPAVPTAVLPSVASTSAAPPESTARPAVSVPATVPARSAAEPPAESEYATVEGVVFPTAESDAPPPPGKAKPNVGKPGERKQLSLFG